MQLLNLEIDRLIIHQVFKRNSDGELVAPQQSHELTRFAESAMDEFKKRVRDALGEGSKAVQMDITAFEEGKLPHLVNNLIDQNDEDFISNSYKIAEKLAEAQYSKGMPGGIVVVFTGSQGIPKSRFLGIIKAEVHSGYEKETNQSGEISLKFVEELLLTPGTKMYKTAGFFEHNRSSESSDLNEKWNVLVSDFQINKSDGKAASQYFYESFLGCGYKPSSARTTKLFYETASSFISGLDVPEEQKYDLVNALTTYLKVDTSETISVGDFGERYLETDHGDLFKEYMEDKGLPTTAITKDVSEIASKLRYRKLKFSKKIVIQAPSQTFKDLIDIEQIEGDADESGSNQIWTKVVIKDRITHQE